MSVVERVTLSCMPPCLSGIPSFWGMLCVSSFYNMNDSHSLWVRLWLKALPNKSSLSFRVGFAHSLTVFTGFLGYQGLRLVHPLSFFTGF